MMVPIGKLVAVRQGKKYVEQEVDKTTDTKKAGRWEYIVTITNTIFILVIVQQNLTWRTIDLGEYLP